MMHSTSHLPSIENLPLTDPRCNNDDCTAYYAAHNLSQATVSFYKQFDYGHWLAWYYAAFILMASLVYLTTLYLNTHSAPRNTSGKRQKPTLLDKLQAYRRWITYRRFRGQLTDSLGLPSIGVLIFLLVGVAVLFAMAFAIRPYYRERQGYGSPPLAIRTGLMAASLTPLLIALGGKVNLITMLTGIGYEKLNVVHRWVGWMMFGLSLAHTIPFLVAPLRDGGYAALHRIFYEPGSFEYTGVPPLAVLFGIVVFSVPWVRHRFYETFYWLHWALGAVYLGLCFWHFGQELDSWTYLWATFGIWLISILGRSFYMNHAFKVTSAWPSSFPTQLSILAGDNVRIDVYVPISLTWAPGQHFYLRLPFLSPFDNHPFTIANIPNSLSKNENGLQKARFIVRVHNGFTRKLASYARANVDTDEATWLEGPYGGITCDISRRYDTLILIAGGSGITACLSWLLHCIQNVAAGTAALHRVKLVWIVRAREHTDWISEELESAHNAINGDDRLKLIFYVTRSGDEFNPSGTRESAAPAEKKGKGIGDEDIELDKSSPPSLPSPSSLGVYHSTRPVIASILPGLLEPGRNMIIGCGPESLKVDIANASAVAQKRVLRGGCTEVALHTESFGWG